MNVLVTGGTGSLGNHLVPYLLGKKINVSVMSRDEDKQQRMKTKYPEVNFFLGDVRSYEDCLNSTYGQDFVIHAAALKRIEFGEESPEQFIKTNIIGTSNIVRATQRNKVKKFVLISTDKACEPINAYGMTKALAEKMVINAGFNCVRYGNVNNSRGSVIPYWKGLAKEGKTLPVTNPNMTRFMISYKEAIELIEEASKVMHGGIYIPKLYSVKIGDLANIISDKTEVIGERPGEKEHELLISRDDFRRGHVVDCPKYYIIYYNLNEFEPSNRNYSSETSEKIPTKWLKKCIDDI